MAGDRHVLLLDGHSLAYRAFHALPDTLRTSTGQLTNAVYGFTSMLLRLLEDREPDAVVVAFDKGRDEERTAAYPEYKANRAETPAEFPAQVDLIKEVLAAFGIQVVEVPGIEADDVLATLATTLTADGAHAYVVTGDRDAMQLVGEDLTVLYTLKGLSELAAMDPAAVAERYGVPPERYVDLAAMRGDSSDNLPGVPGVGDKTAAKLIERFGDLDGIFEHLEDVGGKKVPAMLAEHRDQVELNRQLMTIRRDVPLPIDLGALDAPTPDPAAVRELFDALEFRGLLDRLPAVVAGETRVPTPVVEVETTSLGPGELAEWIEGLEPSRSVAVLFDTEGRVPNLEPQTVTLAASETAAVTIALEGWSPQDRDALGSLLDAAERPIITHDRKLLDHATAALGLSANGVELDTELAAYLLAPQARAYELEQLSIDHLGRDLRTDRDDAADSQLALGLDEDADDAARGRRATALLALAEQLSHELEERDQRSLHDTIELPLASVLAQMERRGVAVDRSVLDELHGRLTERLDALEQEVHDHAGRAFNVGSGPQLQQVLFEELGLPKTRRIKTGYSTDAQALSRLLDAHPIIPAIQEWREVSKLLSTYIDALPPLIDARTGRIHTTFSQTIAATGRLSSAHPNLQNIPVRRPEGREIRRAFVAGDGADQLLVADYSQIELRILAHLSGDAGLLEAFSAGEDIHATTAAKVFDVPLDDVDSTLRDRAKAVNYGLAYGLTSYGLAQQLGIGADEAATIVDAYFARFPDVRAFLDAAVERARRDGYTTTMFGRRRYLPDLRAEDRNRRQMAERMALNAPIQGTAADVIKLAMIALADELERAETNAGLLLQVHDEVILEVAEDQLDLVRGLVERVLGTIVELSVPLEVDSAVGRTWYDAQKH